MDIADSRCCLRLAWSACKGQTTEADQFQTRWIDLSCGDRTGGAPPLLEMVDQFIGIDLSPGMIEKWYAPRVSTPSCRSDRYAGGSAYDAWTPGVESVLSADAMIYVADLFPVLKEVEPCSGLRRPSGFHVGRHDTMVLLWARRRRYAHSASYVRASIEAAGFVVLQFEQQSIRYERGVPVPSLVIVAEKSRIVHHGR